MIVKLFCALVLVQTVFADLAFGPSYLKDEEMCHQWSCLGRKLGLPDPLTLRWDLAVTLKSMLPEGPWIDAMDHSLALCFGVKTRVYVNTCPNQAFLHCLIDQLIENCPDDDWVDDDGCAPVSTLAGFKYMFSQTRYTNLEKMLQKDGQPTWLLKNTFNSKCCDLPEIINSTILSECGFTSLILYHMHPAGQSKPRDAHELTISTESNQLFFYEKNEKDDYNAKVTHDGYYDKVTHVDYDRKLLHGSYEKNKMRVDYHDKVTNDNYYEKAPRDKKLMHGGYNNKRMRVDYNEKLMPDDYNEKRPHDKKLMHGGYNKKRMRTDHNEKVRHDDDNDIETRAYYDNKQMHGDYNTKGMLTDYYENVKDSNFDEKPSRNDYNSLFQEEPMKPKESKPSDYTAKLNYFGDFDFKMVYPAPVPGHTYDEEQLAVGDNDMQPAIYDDEKVEFDVIPIERKPSNDLSHDDEILKLFNTTYKLTTSKPIHTDEVKLHVVTVAQKTTSRPSPAGEYNAMRTTSKPTIPIPTVEEKLTVTKLTTSTPTHAAEEKLHVVTFAKPTRPIVTSHDDENLAVRHIEATRTTQKYSLKDDKLIAVEIIGEPSTSKLTYYKEPINGESSAKLNTSNTGYDDKKLTAFDLKVSNKGQQNQETVTIKGLPTKANLDDWNILNCCNISSFIQPTWASECDFELSWTNKDRLALKNTGPSSSEPPQTTTPKPKVKDVKVVPLSCTQETCVFKRLNIISESGSVNLDAFSKLLNNMTHNYPVWEKAKGRVITTCLTKLPAIPEYICEINTVLACVLDVLSENCPYAPKDDPCRRIHADTDGTSCQISSSKFRPKNRRLYCGVPSLVDHTLMSQCGVISISRMEYVSDPPVKVELANVERKNRYSTRCKQSTQSMQCLLNKMGVLNKYGFMDYFKMKDLMIRLAVDSSWMSLIDVYLNTFTNMPLYRYYCSSPRKFMNLLDAMLTTCPVSKRKNTLQCHRIFTEATTSPPHYTRSQLSRQEIDKIIHGVRHIYPPLFSQNFFKLTNTSFTPSTIEASKEPKPAAPTSTKTPYAFGILNNEDAPPVNIIDVKPKASNPIQRNPREQASVILPVYLRGQENRYSSSIKHTIHHHPTVVKAKTESTKSIWR